jgi:RNA polymerase sigma-70 factor (ECF subfamily)
VFSYAKGPLRFESKRITDEVDRSEQNRLDGSLRAEYCCQNKNKGSRLSSPRCSIAQASPVFTMTAFEDLYTEHVSAVFRFSLHCVGRRDVAEDITSEAFLALYRHLDRIDPDQLPGWLFTVAKNRARDFWRHSEVEKRHANDIAAMTGGSQTSLQDLLVEASWLKPIHRLCLLLRYVYGMSLSEIAAQIGQSEMQVKGHLQYGRKLLREKYAKVS